MYNKLLAVVATSIALQGCLANNLIDPNEVDENGYFDARSGKGNITGIIVARSIFDAGADLLSLVKRQECAPNYGTCPGGTQCGCPGTAGCCGSICSSTSNTCCPGYICPPGWGCCQPTNGDTAQNCYPDGAQCCFDGNYCPGGSSCTRESGYSYARCRVYGSTDDDPPASYSDIATPTAGGSPAPTSGGSGSSGSSDTEYAEYTITWTLDWWYYYYTATTYTFRTTYYSYSTVTYTRTSSVIYLSTSATDSYDAYTLLSDSATEAQSETSASAESVGSSMSSVASSQFASITRAIYSSTPSATNRIFSGDGSVSGGGAPGAASTNSKAADRLFLIGSSAVIAVVGALMLFL